MTELLAPAGDMEKLKYALNYGADAVYFAGKMFGLRAFAGNFDNDEIVEAVNYCHEKGKKAYITVNIIAKDSDFDGLLQYLRLLEKAHVDGVIVADLGIAKFIFDNKLELPVHVSTQANITNSQSAKLVADLGAKRIVLARELSLDEIKNIRKALPDNVELETFVHGAMCISYSGRCLLSNYLCGRDSNRGACVQACRWEYTITEKSRKGEQYEIQEDDRGTYILNSKDLCMISHLDELVGAGVSSFKIEGRMKSPYYVASVVNAYRRALNALQTGETPIDRLVRELEKTSHRRYTTGFYYPGENKECITDSMPVQSAVFTAVVLEDQKDGKVLVEMRNRFMVGDTLEVLSPNSTFLEKIKIEDMENNKGEKITDAKNVQEKLWIKTNLSLKAMDILRK